MKTKYVCLGCGVIAEFDEGGDKGHVSSWICNCGYVNDIADMSQPVVKIISKED